MIDDAKLEAMRQMHPDQDVQELVAEVVRLRSHLELAASQLLASELKMADDAPCSALAHMDECKTVLTSYAPEGMLSQAAKELRRDTWRSYQNRLVAKYRDLLPKAWDAGAKWHSGLRGWFDPVGFGDRDAWVAKAIKKAEEQA